uniref:Core protein n=1 Tax=Hepatitis B virus TaxID=10407 RepID=A0A8F3CIP4_HBV|nr:MAG: core protein [Hepatitis B virus]
MYSCNQYLLPCSRIKHIMLAPFVLWFYFYPWLHNRICPDAVRQMDPLVQSALEGIATLPNDFFPELGDQVKFSRDAIAEYEKSESTNRHIAVIKCALDTYVGVARIYSTIRTATFTADDAQGASHRVALDDESMKGILHLMHAELDTVLRRKLWWHTNCLIWGEAQTAEYTAKLRTWLMTPAAYRNQYAPTIEALTRATKAVHLAARPSRSTTQSTSSRRRRSSKSKSRSASRSKSPRKN